MMMNNKSENMLMYLKQNKLISYQYFRRGKTIKKFHMRMVKKLGLYAPTKDSLTKLENSQPSLYPLHLIGQYGRDSDEEKWRDLMDFFQKIASTEENIAALIDAIIDTRNTSMGTLNLSDITTLKHIIRIGYDLIKNE